MRRVELRLRVDSPYPGESMSSFLSRAAQFYAMPASVLLKSLLDGHKQYGWERRELDLEYGPVLDERLAAAVKNWQSPARNHQGFLEWRLAQVGRSAYCPLCFLDDLRNNQTPYFRNDWIPVLVTTCWRHATPLFDWEMTVAGGWRRWPKEWLYGIGDPLEHVPSFMQQHLRQLEGLQSSSANSIDAGDGISASQAIGYLRRLQHLSEKQSAAPMPGRLDIEPSLGDFRRTVRLLVQLAARYPAECREPPLATVLVSQGKGGWFGSLPAGAMPRFWRYLDSGLRQDGCIRWRRHYLMFVVRTLLRMDRFSSLFPLEGPKMAEPVWTDWWSGTIRPLLGPNQQQAMDGFMKSMTSA